MKKSSMVMGFIVDADVVAPIYIAQSKTSKKHVDMIIGKTVIRFEAKKLIEAVQENISVK